MSESDDSVGQTPLIAGGEALYPFANPDDFSETDVSLDGNSFMESRNPVGTVTGVILLDLPEATEDVDSEPLSPFAAVAEEQPPSPPPPATPPSPPSRDAMPWPPSPLPPKVIRAPPPNLLSSPSKEYQSTSESKSESTPQSTSPSSSSPSTPEQPTFHIESAENSSPDDAQHQRTRSLTCVPEPRPSFDDKCVADKPSTQMVSKDHAPSPFGESRNRSSSAPGPDRTSNHAIFFKYRYL